MRWETTLWMSAVLVVATSALHLTGEHLQTDQTKIYYQSRSETSKLEHNDDTSLAPEITEKYLGRDYDIKEIDVNVSGSTGNKFPSFILRSKKSESTEENVSADSKQESDEKEGSDEKTTSPPGPEVSEGTTTPEVTEDNEQGNTDPTTTVGNDEGTNTPPEAESSCEGTIIKTSTGRVCGHAWQDNPTIISYIDIKYGTYNKRFEAPTDPETDEDAVHSKKVHSKRCPQLQDDKSVGESDCLTLSIFKPSKADLSGASVLVHIHDGNFISGSANPEIYGPEYLVTEDIILVLPNYRLGPLGFLCLQDDEAPGNAALKDLALALKWINTNIEKFGGDPKNIAVSGEGTAGALVGYLALSPISKSYINKVITESGSVLSHWALDRNPTVAAKKLKNSITESLQDVGIDVLLKKAKSIVWRPCLENKTTDKGEHFMLETPWAMLQNKEINTTFMLGSAKYAGVHESLNHTEDSIKQLNANVGLLLPNDLEFETDEEMIEAGNRVKTQYFAEDAISLDNLKPRTLYYTDVAYLGPGVRAARRLVESGATVYFYEFAFVGNLNWELEAVKNQVDGAVRGDIIGYLFHQEGSMPAGTKERKMIEQLVQLWTSFLRTGTPESENVEWGKLEKVTAKYEHWLSIGTEETAVKTGLHVDRLGLWTDIYNKHYIDRSLAAGVNPSAYVVITLQVVFFVSFFRNAWHFF